MSMVIEGGTYEGVHYSGMRDVNQPIWGTQDEKYYFSVGVVDPECGQENEGHTAMMVFDMETKDLVYAELFDLSKEALRDDKVWFDEYRTQVNDMIRRDCIRKAVEKPSADA